MILSKLPAVVSMDALVAPRLPLRVSSASGSVHVFAVLSGYKKGTEAPNKVSRIPAKGDSQVWQLGADLLWRACAVRSRSSRSRRVAWQQTPGQMSAPAIPPCKCKVRNRLFAEYTGAIKRA